jgi:hypothetical protein
MVHVIGLMPGGVEVAAESDGDGAAGAGPNVLMNWDLQLEPASSDESPPAPPKPTVEPPL